MCVSSEAMMTRWSDKSARVSIWRRYFIDIIYLVSSAAHMIREKGTFSEKARARESENERERKSARETMREYKKKVRKNKYLSAGCRQRVMRNASGCCRLMNQGQVKSLLRREKERD